MTVKAALPGAAQWDLNLCFFPTVLSQNIFAEKGILSFKETCICTFVIRKETLTSITFIFIAVAFKASHYSALHYSQLWSCQSPSNSAILCYSSHLAIKMLKKV